MYLIEIFRRGDGSGILHVNKWNGRSWNRITDVSLMSKKYEDIFISGLSEEYEDNGYKVKVVRYPEGHRIINSGKPINERIPEFMNY